MSASWGAPPRRGKRQFASGPLRLRWRQGKRTAELAMPSRLDAAEMPKLDAFDEEFGPDPVPHRLRRKTGLRLSILIAAALVAAIIGALALAWSTADGRRPLPSAGTSPQGAPRAGSVEETDGLLRQVDALKTDVSELRQALQQAAYTIAAMKAAEQESRTQSAHWYSNPAALSFGIVSQPEAVGVAPPERPDSRELRGRDEGAPLSLEAPR
jgi:hypothetical protein